MHLTKCDLTMMLKMAKAAHSKLPKAITDDPHHSWEAWYAEWMLAKMTELDLAETFNNLTEPPIGIHDAHEPESTGWKPVNGSGPAPSCPPGPAQECDDAALYAEEDVQRKVSVLSTPQRNARLSPPSPQSNWR